MTDLESVLRDLLVPAGVARAELLEACASLRHANMMSHLLFDEVQARFNAADAAYSERCRHVVSVLFGFAPELFVPLQGEPEFRRAPGEASDEMCPDRFEPE